MHYMYIWILLFYKLNPGFELLWGKGPPTMTMKNKYVHVLVIATLTLAPCKSSSPYFIAAWSFSTWWVKKP